MKYRYIVNGLSLTKAFSKERAETFLVLLVVHVPQYTVLHISDSVLEECVPHYYSTLIFLTTAITLVYRKASIAGSITTVTGYKLKSFNVVQAGCTHNLKLEPTHCKNKKK